MLSRRSGVTLLELIVVLIIIGVAAAFTAPNYINPFEQAKAASARNNLLAIYTAEQNYKNNNGNYCVSTSATPCDSLADINTAFTLDIQDDGSYTYSCPVATNTCVATRNNPGAVPVLTVTLTTPINLPGNGNPTCLPASIACN